MAFPWNQGHTEKFIKAIEDVAKSFYLNISDHCKLIMLDTVWFGLV